MIYINDIYHAKPGFCRRYCYQKTRSLTFSYPAAAALMMLIAWKKLIEIARVEWDINSYSITYLLSACPAVAASVASTDMLLYYIHRPLTCHTNAALTCEIKLK